MIEKNSFDYKICYTKIMKKILFVLFFSFCLLGTIQTANAEPGKEGGTVNAGFVSGIWYSKSPFFSGDSVRIYAAIQNQSGSDLTGTLAIYDGARLLGEAPFSAIAGRLVEQWVDWKATGGPHQVYAIIKNAKKTAVGGVPEPINLQFASSTPEAIEVDLDTDRDGVGNQQDADDDNDGVSDTQEQAEGTNPLITNAPREAAKDNSTPEPITEALATISEKAAKLADLVTGRGDSTVEPDAPQTDNSEKSPSRVVATLKSIGNAIYEATQKFVVQPVSQKLKQKDAALKEQINARQGTDPLFADQVKTIEDKTFLKIPEDKKPTLQHIYSWLIGALIYVLNSKWLLLIVGLILLNLLWKIIRLLRRKEP